MNQNLINTLETTLADFNLPAKAITKIAQYYDLLLSWNQKFNLTAITKEQDVVIKHFYDSLLLLKAKPLTTQSVVDLGTGPGLPGIIIKIACPHIKLTLVEASQKKCQFLTTVIEALNLNQTVVLNQRAEVKTTNKQFDLVIARALAPLPILLELVCQWAKLKGTIVAYKGSQAAAELAAANSALSVLKLKLAWEKSFILPVVNEKRVLLGFTKTAKTPPKYPRAFSQIKHNPL